MILQIYFLLFNTTAISIKCESFNFVLICSLITFIIVLGCITILLNTCIDGVLFIIDIYFILSVAIFSGIDNPIELNGSYRMHCLLQSGHVVVDLY